jgi:hypothetical protein
MMTNMTEAIALSDTTQQEQIEGIQDQKSPIEFGGPAGLEPTRFGDWEQKGRCSDF